MDMLKHDCNTDSKTGRIGTWILSLLLVVTGLALVIVSPHRIHVDRLVSLAVGGGLAVFGIIGFISLIRKHPVREPEEEEVLPKPDELNDEPDERIVVNPTRMGEPTGSILFFRKEGFIEYNGARIPLDLIDDVSFTNVALPYFPGEYHILLNLKDGRVVHVPAGMDGTYAQETVQALRDALICKE